jgi:metallo-beta-lactamase superfamily protein
MAGNQHEVLIVRYGARTTTRGDVFLNYHAYGEPDGPIEMDYFFWVIRGDAGPVVVDTGFSRDAGRARGRTMLIDPRDALADLGIERADAPPVIITHAHYDHIGNLSHFNESRVVVARAEADSKPGRTRGTCCSGMAAGPVVLASDAVHYYEEMRRDMPFSSVASLVDMYAAFAELRAMLTDGRAAHVVSGHDPATLDLYPQVPGPSGAKMAVIGRQT